MSRVVRAAFEEPRRLDPALPFLFLLATAPAPAAAQEHLLHLESLGVPATSTAPVPGRRINDLHAWEGRLYVGHGDATENTGPTEILSMDPVTGKVRIETVTREQAVERFVEAGGRLVALGADSNGMLYVRTDTAWEAREVVPGTNHVLDLVEHGGRWFAGTAATRFRFADGRGYPVGAVMASDDDGRSFGLSFATPVEPGRLRQYRIPALAAFRDRLHAFPTLIDWLEKEEIPGDVHATLGAPYAQRGRYPIVGTDPWGAADAVVWDGARWTFTDLVPGRGLAGVRAVPFAGRLLLFALRGEYMDGRDLRSGFPPQASTDLYAFDGESARPVDFGGGNVKDVLVRDGSLYLLVWRDDLRFIAESDDLERWKRHFLPGTGSAPQAVERIGSTFFVGMADGNVFRSVASEPAASLAAVRAAVPGSFVGQARFPSEAVWYGAAVTGWRNAARPAELTVRRRGRDLSIETDNVSRFLLFPDGSWPRGAGATMTIEGDAAYHRVGEPGGALEATLGPDGWTVRPVPVEGDRFRPPPLTVGATAAPVSPDGDPSTAALFKAAAYVQATGADLAFAHQWASTLQLPAGPVDLERLVRGLGADSIYLYRLTGTEIDGIARFNDGLDNRFARVGWRGTSGGLHPDSTYLVAGDLHEAGALEGILGRPLSWTATGLSSLDAVVGWLRSVDTVPVLRPHPPRLAPASGDAAAARGEVRHPPLPGAGTMIDPTAAGAAESNTRLERNEAPDGNLR